MMTLKISVFRILFFVSGSIIRNVLCFNQTSSSDDVAQLPDIGVSGPKDSPPPLQSESADDEDQLPKTKQVERPPPSSHRNHARGRNHGRGCDKAADTHRRVVFNLGNYMHHICFVCFIQIMFSTSYCRSVSTIHTTIAMNQ